MSSFILGKRTRLADETSVDGSTGSRARPTVGADPTRPLCLEDRDRPKETRGHGPVEPEKHRRHVSRLGFCPRLCPSAADGPGASLPEGPPRSAQRPSPPRRAAPERHRFVYVALRAAHVRKPASLDHASFFTDKIKARLLGRQPAPGYGF